MRAAEVVQIAAEVVRLATEQGATIATAESVTAGLLAARIADIRGCSACFLGGVVAYATPLKESILGVPFALLDHVVAEPVAVAMARGVCHLMGSDIGVGTTGAAGPDWLDSQPPGTIWIAVHDSRLDVSSSELLHLEGDRERIRAATVNASLSLLITVLLGYRNHGNFK